MGERQPDQPFDIFRVVWRIASEDSGEALVPALQEKLRTQAWNPGWREEAPELWRAIVREEALECLLVCLDDHQLGRSFSPGEKTSMVLEAALETYSLARVWGMIWRAAKDAAAARARGTPPWQAANSVITRVQGFTERAVANKWELTPYRRSWRAPRSALSQTFFDGLLRFPAYEDERTPPRHEAPQVAAGPPSPEDG